MTSHERLVATAFVGVGIGILLAYGLALWVGIVWP
jgi:hypothetical protein